MSARLVFSCYHISIVKFVLVFNEVLHLKTECFKTRMCIFFEFYAMLYMETYQVACIYWCRINNLLVSNQCLIFWPKSKCLNRMINYGQNQPELTLGTFKNFLQRIYLHLINYYKITEIYISLDIYLLQKKTMLS